MNDESDTSQSKTEELTKTDDFRKSMVGVFFLGVMMVIWGVDMPSKPSFDNGWFLSLTQSFLFKFETFAWLVWNRYLGGFLVFFSLDQILLKGWCLNHINIILSKCSTRNP